MTKPATTHVEPLSDIEYTTHLDILTGLIRSLTLVPTDRLLHHLDRVETLAPLLDPTAYHRRGWQNLRDQRRVLEAADRLRTVALEITAAAITATANPETST